MANTIKFLYEADIELQEAAVWYEGQSKGLGLKLISIIKTKLEIIQKYPERYPKRKNNFREASVKTFPYSII